MQNVVQISGSSNISTLITAGNGLCVESYHVGLVLTINVYQRAINDNAANRRHHRPASDEYNDDFRELGAMTHDDDHLLAGFDVAASPERRPDITAGSTLIMINRRRLPSSVDRRSARCK
jgi:hypothetical protein